MHLFNVGASNSFARSTGARRSPAGGRSSSALGISGNMNNTGGSVSYQNPYAGVNKNSNMGGMSNGPAGVSVADLREHERDDGNGNGNNGRSPTIGGASLEQGEHVIKAKALYSCESRSRAGRPWARSLMVARPILVVQTRRAKMIRMRSLSQRETSWTSSTTLASGTSPLFGTRASL